MCPEDRLRYVQEWDETNRMYGYYRWLTEENKIKEMLKREEREKKYPEEKKQRLRWMEEWEERNKIYEQKRLAGLLETRTRPASGGGIYGPPSYGHSAPY